MPYQVQFVGLVCFFREREARLALLPDGRTPDAGIAPHFGTIIVNPSEVLAKSGWDGVPGATDGNFPLDEPCQILLAGATTAGNLDSAQQDRALPQLKQINSEIEIDPSRAQTIARVPILQGRLTAHRVPGGTALISQLDLSHDGPIEIVIKLDDGSAERKITLAPGTEIVIANMARGGIYREPRAPNGAGKHFKIYELLGVNRVPLNEPGEVAVLNNEVTESTSTHVLFSRRGPISIYTDCSNTGCC